MATNTITRHDIEKRLYGYVQSIENVGSTIPGIKDISPAPQPTQLCTTMHSYAHRQRLCADVHP